MSPSTLIKVFEKITREKRSYCFLCFRTDEERKLKTPQSVLKGLTSLGMENNINDQPPRICFMCERIAMAAVNFQKATFYATSIDIVFKGMMESVNYRVEVKKHLDRNIPEKVKDKQRYETLLSYEQQLKSLRKKTLLQRTDVMVVVNSDIITKDPNTTICNNVTSYTRSPIARKRDRKQDDLKPTNDSPISSHSDDIIILDDVPETAPEKRNKTVYRARSKTNPTGAQVVANLTKNNQPSPSKLTRIPTQVETPKKDEPKPTKIQSVKPNMQLTTLVPIEKLMPARETILIDTGSYKKASVGYLHPIVTSEDGVHTVPTLAAQLLNGTIKLSQAKPDVGTKTADTSATEPTLTIENDPTGSDRMCLVLTDPAGNVRILPTVERTSVVLGNVNEAAPVQRPQPPVQPARDTAEVSPKKPVLKNDRIDWEDKIPMDVISFMDATDPHPPSYIKPASPATPVGVISNVRSLHNDPPPNTGQRVDDVIDLC